MPAGLSIPTSLLSTQWTTQWTTWLTATDDGPVLALLGLVLLSCGLGVWWRRGRA